MSQDWKRLGMAMRRRRLELTNGDPNRSKFFDLKEVGASQRRLLMDLENAKRTNYEQGTLDLVEHVYEWGSGSVDAVLAGEEPMLQLSWIGPPGEPEAIVTARARAELAWIREQNLHLTGHAHWEITANEVLEYLRDLLPVMAADHRRVILTMATTFAEAAIALSVQAPIERVADANPKRRYLPGINIEQMAADEQDEISIGLRKRQAQDAVGEDPQV